MKKLAFLFLVLCVPLSAQIDSTEQNILDKYAGIILSINESMEDCCKQLTSDQSKLWESYMCSMYGAWLDSAFADTSANSVLLDKPFEDYDTLFYHNTYRGKMIWATIHGVWFEYYFLKKNFQRDIYCEDIIDSLSIYYSVSDRLLNTFCLNFGNFIKLINSGKKVKTPIAEGVLESFNKIRQYLAILTYYRRSYKDFFLKQKSK